MATSDVGELKIKLSFDTKSLDTSQKEVESKLNGGYSIAKNVVANFATSALQKVGEVVRGVAEVGMSFDSAMSKVSAVSGATGEDLDKLRQKAEEMGGSTKFTATQSAEAFNYMAMAGWDTTQMLDGIDGVLALAAASGADLATTSDIVTDALTAMGYAAGDAGRLADVMAAASSNANTNVEMMGETFKYAAPSIGTLGYSMEDAATMIGLMANSGIKASQAGTAMRSILTRLATPTAEVEEAMRDLGLSLTDSEGNMKSLDTVMRDVQGAFSGLDEVQKTQYADMLAGKNALSGFLAVANASPEDMDKLTTAIAESDGAAQEMAETMQDNLGGKMTTLGSKFEGLQITLYEKIEPALSSVTDALQWLVDGATGAVNFISENEFAMWALESVLIAIGAAILYTVVPAVWSFTVALLTNPITWITLAIGGLVAGLIMLATHIDEVGQFFEQVFGAIGEFIGGVVDDISHWFEEMVNNIKSVFDGVVHWIDEHVIQPVSNFFSGLWEGIERGVQGVKEVISRIFDTIVGIIKTPINGIISAINGVLSTINSITVPDWVPIIGGAHTDFGMIPTLAAGAYMNAPTLNIAGEAGKEVALPLERNTDNWSGLLAKTLMDEMEQDGYGGRGGFNVEKMEFNIDNELDARDIGRVMMESMRRAAA